MKRLALYLMMRSYRAGCRDYIHEQNEIDLHQNWKYCGIAGYDGAMWKNKVTGEVKTI